MKMRARGDCLSRSGCSSGFIVSAALEAAIGSPPALLVVPMRRSMLDCPPMRRIAVLSAAIFLSCISVAQTTAPNVVRYKLDEKKLKYLFSTCEPVMHLKSDDVLETSTVDCFGNVLQK